MDDLMDLVPALQIAVERVRGMRGPERDVEMCRQAEMLAARTVHEQVRALRQIESALVEAATGDVPVMELGLDEVMGLNRLYMIRGLARGAAQTGDLVHFWRRR